MEARHSGEKVDLALFCNLDDANSAPFIPKVIESEFTRESFAIGGKAFKQTVDVVGCSVQEEVHVFSQTNIAV